MRAYVAVRDMPPPAAPQALGYNNRAGQTSNSAAVPPARAYRSGYAYAGVAAARQPAPARRRVGQRTWLAILGSALGVGAVGLILALVLVGGLSGRTGGGRYSAYRPAGIGGVLGFIAGNPQPEPATASDAATDLAPAASAAAPANGDRRPVAPPSADHAVMAAPSVSAALIDQVLTDYHSPAAGQGAIFYDLGVQYGIDPAYALAFFIHESSAGTKGVARFTNAIGNIRTTPGYRDYEGYRAYDTWAAGIEDWYKLIKDLYVEGWGKGTVAQIIPTYAPSADRNDPPSYIATVTGLVDSWQQK